MADEHSPEQTLARILRSNQFGGLPYHARLLRTICEATQRGGMAPLHEHDLGVAVLGLEPGYDVQANPVIRELTNEIRDKLKAYFQSEGRRERIRLAIPKGEFRAFFYEADPREVELAEATPTLFEQFWQRYIETPSLLLHGELPGPAAAIAMGEAYALVQLVAALREQGAVLQLMPASAMEDESLSGRNVILLGASVLVERLRTQELDDILIERIPPCEEHGTVTILTARDPDALIVGAKAVTAPDGLEQLANRFPGAEFPPAFYCKLHNEG